MRSPAGSPAYPGPAGHSDPDPVRDDAGTTRWFITLPGGGQMLHRDDGPAIVYTSSTPIWRLHGTPLETELVPALLRMHSEEDPDLVGLVTSLWTRGDDLEDLLAATSQAVHATT